MTWGIENSFNEIQEEIKGKLEENTSFFTSHYKSLTATKQLSPCTTELSRIFELEMERMDNSLEKAKGFTIDLERVAGDIIKLAKERKELYYKITRNRQFNLIKNSLDRMDLLINSETSANVDFKEISNLLLANEELFQQYCQNYREENYEEEIDFKIKLQRRRIGQKVIETFERNIEEGIEDPIQLFSCSLAGDILEIRADIIKIYLDKQYTSYRTLFPVSVNVLDLKNIGKRFKWAQRMLNFYEKTFKFAFPSEWQVEILFGQAVGNWIKEDIVVILSGVPMDRRVSEDIFTQSLSEANSFDRYITLRFKSTFTSTVTQAFQDFHYFLFEAKEDEFNTLKREILPANSLKSLQKVLKKDQLVIANFDQFFLFFSSVLETFVHLSSMSSGVLLVQFSFFLSDCLESLKDYIEGQFQVIAQMKKWSDEVGKLVCCLLNTLDYCVTSSQEQTNQILSQIRSEDLRLQVSLESVQQKILISRTVGMTVLLNKIETDLLLPVFQNYLKTDWDKLKYPQDPSPFYTKIIESLEFGSKSLSIPNVIKMLQPQTSQVFLEKLITMFMKLMQNYLFKFKLINEIAAEQLMIALFSFRSYFTQRIVPNQWKAKELATWCHVVSKTTERYELHLKVLLTPINPVTPFVQSYLILLTDFNLDNFNNFLNLKGLPNSSTKSEFIQEFLKHNPPTPSSNIPNSGIADINDTDLNESKRDLITFANSALSHLKNVVKRTYRRSQKE